MVQDAVSTANQLIRYFYSAALPLDLSIPMSARCCGTKSFSSSSPTKVICSAVLNDLEYFLLKICAGCSGYHFGQDVSER